MSSHAFNVVFQTRAVTARRVRSVSASTTALEFFFGIVFRSFLARLTAVNDPNVGILKLDFFPPWRNGRVHTEFFRTAKTFGVRKKKQRIRKNVLESKPPVVILLEEFVWSFWGDFEIEKRYYRAPPVTPVTLRWLQEVFIFFFRANRRPRDKL